MPVREAYKCRCPEPDPSPAFIFGAWQRCRRCGRIVNWRDFEPQPEGATA